MENRRLQNLLDFVRKDQQYGSQEMMELLEGTYCFPPIFPGIDPESDWFRFQLWLQGEPTRKTITEQLPETFLVKNLDDIPEEEMEAELDKLLEAVHQAGYGIGLNHEIPARLAYKQVLEWMGEKIELSGSGGGWTFDGCSGYCPGCFQRPWCDTGNSLCWREDEEAGKMHLTEELKDYVSASPQSLEILQKSQAEQDAASEKFRAENPDSGFSDFEGQEDWKAGMN